MRDMNRRRWADGGGNRASRVATLHTQDAPESLERLINMFPTEPRRPDSHAALTGLRAIICQKLVRALGRAGRCARDPPQHTPHQKLILEGDTTKIPAAIQASRTEGMQTFNQALADLVAGGESRAGRSAARLPETRRTQDEPARHFLRHRRPDLARISHHFLKTAEPMSSGRTAMRARPLKPTTSCNQVKFHPHPYPFRFASQGFDGARHRMPATMVEADVNEPVTRLVGLRQSLAKTAPAFPNLHSTPKRNLWISVKLLATRSNTTPRTST